MRVRYHVFLWWTRRACRR